MEDSSARQRLLDSAVLLFNLRGYHATAVQDIVADAGLTKGGFYHYFSSKDDCLREIHKDFIEGELARLEAAVARSDSPTEAIRQIVRTFLYGVREYSAQVRIFDQEWRHLETEGFADIRKKRDRIDEIVTGQVEEGIRLGVFEPVDNPRLAALAIIGMCGWAHRWYQPGGKKSSDDIADLWSEMVLDGLKSPNP